MNDNFSYVDFIRSAGFRGVLFVLFVLAGAVCVVEAVLGYRMTRGFSTPVAFTVVNDDLYVLEKDRNTLLRLDYEHGSGMKLLSSTHIERDDARYYYMVRKLFSASGTLVAQSYIYDKRNGDFLGYRFREYYPDAGPPSDIFTIFLENPKGYEEVKYARAKDGTHVFVNDCSGHHNIWKLPADKSGVIMSNGVVPEVVFQAGVTNDGSSFWGSVATDPDDGIYVACNALDCVMKYSPDGSRSRPIGSAGFDQGELLAPGDMSFVSFGDEPESLVVASTGNRTWIQLDDNGEVLRTVSPLDSMYPYKDILVGSIFRDTDTGKLFSFDLANKALVEIGERFGAVETYTALRPGRSAALLIAAALLFGAGFFLRTRPLLSSNFRFPFFLKLLLLFTPIILLGAYISGDWVRDVMKRDIETETARRSANLAWAIRNTISPEDLAKIQRPEDRNSEIYEKIFSTVSNIVNQAHVEDTPKWIIHKIKDGKFYFGINIWRGPLFEPFIVPRDKELFFRVARDNVPLYGSFADSQGEWFSYLCPVANSAGDVAWIIELYRPSERLHRADRKAMMQVAKIAGITTLFMAVVVFIFSYVTTRPLVALKTATHLISKGDFGHRVKIKSHDELSELAQSFNQMAGSLADYTADIARTTAEREKIQNELNFAREVQRGILPVNFPPHEGVESVEIFGRMETAREVGGDYYDFFMVDDDHIGVVVADVSDKGMAAGLFMMDVRTIMRTNAVGRLSVAEALEKTNKMILDDNPAMMFVTMFYLICNIRTGRVSYCSAGHNPPVLVKRHNPSFLKNKAGQGRGPAAGVLEAAQYTDAEFVLEEGEYIVLYTDGVTECSDKDNNMYGEERLLNCLSANSSLPNKVLCDNLFDELSAFYTGVDQFDDITVLFFRFLGAGGGCCKDNMPQQHKTEFVLSS